MSRLTWVWLLIGASVLMAIASIPATGTRETLFGLSAGAFLLSALCAIWGGEES